MMSDMMVNTPAPDNASVHLMRSECLPQGASLSIESLLTLAAASPAAAANWRNSVSTRLMPFNCQPIRRLPSNF